MHEAVTVSVPDVASVVVQVASVHGVVHFAAAVSLWHFVEIVAREVQPNLVIAARLVIVTLHSSELMMAFMMLFLLRLFPVEGPEVGPNIVEGTRENITLLRFAGLRLMDALQVVVDTREVLRDLSVLPEVLLFLSALPPRDVVKLRSAVFALPSPIHVVVGVLALNTVVQVAAIVGQGNSAFILPVLSHTRG